MYDHINYVLASYFNVAIAGSNAEAERALSRDVMRNKDFFRLLHDEMVMALVDEEFSWIEAFEVNEVDFFSNEEEARARARALLWDPYFAG